MKNIKYEPLFIDIKYFILQKITSIDVAKEF